MGMDWLGTVTWLARYYTICRGGGQAAGKGLLQVRTASEAGDRGAGREGLRRQGSLQSDREGRVTIRLCLQRSKATRRNDLARGLYWARPGSKLLSETSPEACVYTNQEPETAQPYLNPKERQLGWQRAAAFIQGGRLVPGISGCDSSTADR